MVVVYYDLPYLIMVWYGTVLYGRVVFDVVRYGIFGWLVVLGLTAL